MKRKIIDISTPISNSTPVYPGDPEPAIEPITSIESDGFKISSIFIGSHTGTHIDVPSHVFPEGGSTDDILLEELIGEAAVLDISSYENKPVNSRILHEKLQGFDHSSTPEILLLNSGNNCPTISIDIDTWEWIVHQDFRIIGTSCMSVDISNSMDVHQLLLKNNIYIIESLNLAEVEEGIYFFIALPMKISGCDGAPVRAILMEY
ncbi:Kynurenine formamidase [Methanosalsum zhilinae DSM 4017]|uniref:Kynurenine formamidase n=1 Tax=Methanosalsum zhilinae (strain DSM 4017 / NBRC 107636 / OCM 62 / WeN5) TaxID=679901 RepID=F7XLF0_METZD|nr:cyclase family protein [Methanosalsum zhilinae]AEH60361.1 Kynurenine formamidase [Methanosalsum zhilinae DSM 4017]